MTFQYESKALLHLHAKATRGNNPETLAKYIRLARLRRQLRMELGVLALHREA